MQSTSACASPGKTPAIRIACTRPALMISRPARMVRCCNFSQAVHYALAIGKRASGRAIRAMLPAFTTGAKPGLGDWDMHGLGRSAAAGRLAALLLMSTCLAGVAAPAWADGGSGGFGLNSPGGSGGSDSATGAGGTGGNGDGRRGGGGGGGRR